MILGKKADLKILQFILYINLRQSFLQRWLQLILQVSTVLTAAAMNKLVANRHQSHQLKSLDSSGSLRVSSERKKCGTAKCREQIENAICEYSQRAMLHIQPSSFLRGDPP